MRAVSTTIIKPREKLPRCPSLLLLRTIKFGGKLAQWSGKSQSEPVVVVPASAAVKDVVVYRPQDQEKEDKSRENRVDCERRDTEKTSAAKLRSGFFDQFWDVEVPVVLKYALAGVKRSGVAGTG